MKTLTMLLLLLICVAAVRGSSPARNLIKSFIASDDRPTSLLTPYLCWSQHEQTSLAKSLFSRGVDISSSANTSEHQLHHVLFLADLSCPGVDELLVKVSGNGFFRSPLRWLLLDLEGGHKYELLSKLDMPINSDVVVAKRRSSTEYQLVEVYKIAPGSDVVFSTRAVWLDGEEDRQGSEIIIINGSDSHNINKQQSRIVDYRESRVLSVRRRNIRRHPLTVVNVIADSNDTRRHLDDRLNLHQDSITKMTYMMVKICFEMMNATEQLLFTNTWGYKDKQGNWNGIVNHLVKKEADLGTLTIFTQERLKIIDYIAMVGSTAVRFVFREPPLALLSNIFALPFTAGVWLAIFVCVLACALFLYITSKWEASVGMHPLQLDGSWADVLILIIGAVLQQGCNLEPRYAAGRCVTLLLFLALTILYSAYCANIVVLLRAPSSSVRSVPDLLTSPLKLGASDFEYNRYFFKKLNDPIRKTIYDKKIAPKGKKPNFYSMKEGVERIRKGLFAFHMELNPGYRLIQETYREDEKCDLVEIDYINEIDPWVPGQKRSPYNDMFKINFIKIRESGIQSCIHHRLHVGKPKCSGSISTFSSVGFTDMYPAIIATLYGMLLAPAVLLLEIMFKRITILKEKRKIMQQKNES